MKKLLPAFIFLMLSLAVFASCPEQTREIFVPAVVGESGGDLLQIEVKTGPGDGTVWSAIAPKAGLSTQESELDAAKWAMRKAGVQNSCDVFFYVRGAEESNFVDGPSAGAAMAVATWAALENRSIRQDVAITGAANRKGEVGPVGGIIEKVRGATGKGVHIVLVPPLSFYERLVLTSMENRYSLTLVEVHTVEEAGGIFFSQPNTSVNATLLNLTVEPLPQNISALENKGDEDLQLFRRAVAEVIVGQVNDEVESLEGRQANLDYQQFKEYFRKEMAQQEELLQKGYVYTAANNAFLIGVDVDFFKRGYAEEVPLSAQEAEVNACLAQVGNGSSGKTLTDWEWRVGSDLRRTWAEEKMRETLESVGDTGEEKYAAQRELLYSLAWCRTAKLLSEAGNERASGPEINESAWEPLAKQAISEAEKALADTGEDTEDEQWHLQMAQAEQAQGMYGAAVFDATFARAMAEAGGEFSLLTDADKAQRFANLSNRRYNTLWAKIYQTQGKYLLAEGTEEDTAYRIFALADALEEQGLALKAGQEKNLIKEAEAENKGAESKGKAEDNGALFLYLVAAFDVCGLAILLVYVFCKRKKTKKKTGKKVR